MDRRVFVGDGLQVGIASLLGRQLHAAVAPGLYSPLPSGPQIARFTNAEERLLSRYHLSAQSRFVRTKSAGLPMRVLEFGIGEPVLLLHGGGLFGASWASLLVPLAERYKAYSPDLPGCGLTYRIDYRGVPLRTTAENLVTDIMDGLQIPKANVIGSSLGGYFALVFSLAHPERVEKLVLIGEPAGSKRKVASDAMRMPQRVSMEDTRQSWSDVIVAHIDRVDTSMLEADNADSNIPGYVDSWNSFLDELARERHLGLTYKLRPELKHLEPDTLFIWGDKDFFGPPSEGQEMAALAPHARCKVVSDAGHAVWFDQPEQCNTLVMEFLASKNL